MSTWAERLHETIKNYLPWLQMFKCTPALRHKPLPQDDEIEFWNDCRYMEELAEAINQECIQAKYEDPDEFCTEIARPPAAALAIPVESQRFWREFGEWPVDYAAHLLSLWRFDREMTAWLDRCDPDEVVA